MHYESLVIMDTFIKKYLDPAKKLKILDVGSSDQYGGSYRGLFSNYTPEEIYYEQKIEDKDHTLNPNWTYTGGDLQAGNNVDEIFKDPYDWGLTEQFDVVISGQVLEHIEDTHKWILEIRKVLKDGGITCIIVPWSFREHKVPVDCWRVFPDGMSFLLKMAGLEIVKVYKYMGDTVGIARKV